ISPTSALPTITDAVTIDATTQPGWVSAPIIELDGTNAGAGTTGLTITASNTTVRGFVINRFKAQGIDLTSGATGDLIQDNYIGTDTLGSTDLGNTGQGIRIDGGAANNTIGGSTPGDGNVISGNDNLGIYIVGATTSGNVVVGNFIGMNAAGSD